jgi:hypothetical protein
MKARKRKKRAGESPYELLVHSEEAARGYLETAFYALVVVSVVAAIMQFALQNDPLPLSALPATTPFA